MKRECTVHPVYTVCSHTYVVCNSIASTLVARFILDLRSVHPYNSVPDQAVSSAQFTTVDFTAPSGPDFTSVTGQNNDLETNSRLEMDAEVHSASAAEHPIRESA